jgi:hypothetical protein
MEVMAILMVEVPVMATPIHMDIHMVGMVIHILQPTNAAVNN